MTQPTPCSHMRRWVRAELQGTRLRNASELVAILPVGLPRWERGRLPGFQFLAGFHRGAGYWTHSQPSGKKAHLFLFGVSRDEVGWRDWLALFSAHAFNYSGGWQFSSRVVGTPLNVHVGHLQPVSRKAVIWSALMLMGFGKCMYMLCWVLSFTCY